MTLTLTQEQSGEGQVKNNFLRHSFEWAALNIVEFHQHLNPEAGCSSTCLLNPSTWREAEAFGSLLVPVQSCLHSKFQGCQDFIERPCLGKTNKETT